jgi:hypothetical protein
MEMEWRMNAPKVKSPEVIGRVAATPVCAKILDLTSSGCLAECGSPLIQQGRTILLDLSESCEVAGTVAWKVGNRVGIEFADLISPAEMTRLLSVKGGEPARDKPLQDSFGRSQPPLSGRFRLI